MADSAGLRPSDLSSELRGCRVLLEFIQFAQESLYEAVQQGPALLLRTSVRAQSARPTVSQLALHAPPPPGVPLRGVGAWQPAATPPLSEQGRVRRQRATDQPMLRFAAYIKDSRFFGEAIDSGLSVWTREYASVLAPPCEARGMQRECAVWSRWLQWRSAHATFDCKCPARPPSAALAVFLQDAAQRGRTAADGGLKVLK